MDGQIELLDYLETLENKGVDILNYIPKGQENAVTRAELCKRTGLTDRMMRDALHDAKLKTPILNMQDGRGYFIPDMNLENDRFILLRHVRQEESRIRSTIEPLEVERQTLRNCGIDWREAGEQQEQRSEGRA